MRLVDADEIRKKAVPHTRGEHGYAADIRKWAVLVGDIDDAPTIDAVPVVRCKDCKHCKKHPTSERVNICTNAVWNREYHPLVADYDFCSYGERKDGDTNG